MKPEKALQVLLALAERLEHLKVDDIPMVQAELDRQRRREQTHETAATAVREAEQRKTAAIATGDVDRVATAASELLIAQARLEAAQAALESGQLERVRREAREQLVAGSMETAFAGAMALRPRFEEDATANDALFHIYAALRMLAPTTAGFAQVECLAFTGQLRLTSLRNWKPETVLASKAIG